MTRSAALLLLAVLAAAPALAQNKPAESSKDASKNDDDILAPVDEKGKPKATDPSTKAKKVGFVNLVAIGDAQKPLADDVSKRMAKELNESSFGVLPLALPSATTTATGPTEEDAAKTAVADGDAQLQKAEQLAEKKLFGKAITSFEAALAAYEKGAAALPDVASLIRARSGLAVALASTGREPEANAQLRAIAVLNPEHELDRTLFPPQAIRTFQVGRDALMAEPKGRVFVDESATGAEVFLDGRSVGAAPVRIADVPPGRHVVRAVRALARAHGVVVDVAGGAEAAVAPGFLKQGARGPIDELMRNSFSPDAAKAVADAAKAAAVDAAIVGVVGRVGEGVPVGMLLVDAATAGVVVLPRLDFLGDLLDLAIEMTSARDAIEPALAGKKKYAPAKEAPLLEGVAVGAGAKVAEVAMRYEFTPAPKEKRSRVTGEADEEEPAAVAAAPAGEEGGRAIAGSGSSGRRATLRDEESRFGDQPVPVEDMAEDEVPLSQQAWFWPTVIGASAGGALVLLAGGVVGAVALGFDPRPTGGAEVSLVLPEEQ
jgi:hypothetical protein